MSTMPLPSRLANSLCAILRCSVPSAVIAPLRCSAQSPPLGTPCGRIIVHVLRDLVDDTFLGFYRTLSVFLVLYLLVGSGMVSLHATNVEIAERGRLLTELANNLRRKEGRLNC